MSFLSCSRFFLALQIKTYCYLDDWKLGICVSLVSETLKSLSALITAESLLVLCSNRLVHYHKHKLHIILTIIISKRNNCLVAFFDMLRYLIGLPRSWRWTQNLCRQLSWPFPSALAVQRSKGLAARADYPRVYKCRRSQRSRCLANFDNSYSNFSNYSN